MPDFSLERAWRGPVAGVDEVGRGALAGPERERIFRILEEQPDISMYGLSRALAAEGVSISAQSVQRFLKRHSLDRETRRARRRGRRHS